MNQWSFNLNKSSPPKIVFIPKFIIYEYNEYNEYD